jgi:hypothetical protein
MFSQIIIRPKSPVQAEIPILYAIGEYAENPIYNCCEYVDDRKICYFYYPERINKKIIELENMCRKYNLDIYLESQIISYMYKYIYFCYSKNVEVVVMTKRF